MRVSVVVPCFNHERYVSECLASIDAQDHGDLEVIVIDDGSSDGSWDRIRQHRWSAGREVKPVRTENLGAHAALNRGLEMATGDFVALCNSDDAFGSGRISALVARALKDDARFLFSGVDFIDSAGRVVNNQWDYARDLRRKQAEIREFPSVGFALVLSNVAVSTGNFFFSRSLIDEIGFFRPYRYCHDWDFVLRALLRTEPVFVPAPLYRYRLHPENSFRALANEARTECPELMRRYMKAAARNCCPNRLAPSPSNWPGYFEYFIEEYGYQGYLAGWNAVDEPMYHPSKVGTAPRSPSALTNIQVAI